MLGSTSLFGGFGTIIGTLLGALSIAVIQNGLILSHIFAVLHPDSHRHHYPAGYLAEHHILNPTRSAAKDN